MLVDEQAIERLKIEVGNGLGNVFEDVLIDDISVLIVKPINVINNSDAILHDQSANILIYPVV
jgi:hypothetical protein